MRGLRRCILAVIIAAVFSGFPSAAFADDPPMPAVVAPADGATVSQASDAIELQPHNGIVWAIKIAHRPDTVADALGTPPTGANQDLQYWVAKLGVHPDLSGSSSGQPATR